MAHLLSQDILVKVAGGLGTGTGSWTPVEVNASGFDKVLFSAGRGAEAGATKGQFSTSVYDSATTAGTYALIAGSLGTSGTSDTNKALLTEILVDPAKPFLKMYGTSSTTGSSLIPVVAVALLYRGSRTLPPSQDITVISA
jgi:hypothetical protein